jgi:hypothetical protein
MSIFNLTQHIASKEQIAAGVVEPDNAVKAQIRELLTFEKPPSQYGMHARAQLLAQIVKQHNCPIAMIGGAPYFMAPLEKWLLATNIVSYYSFSERVVIEVTEPDGSVTKKSSFVHSGWVIP